MSPCTSYWATRKQRRPGFSGLKADTVVKVGTAPPRLRGSLAPV
jgi:hypothetical protein